MKQFEQNERMGADKSRDARMCHRSLRAEVRRVLVNGVAKSTGDYKVVSTRVHSLSMAGVLGNKRILKEESKPVRYHRTGVHAIWPRDLRS
jgi:hypothetical protein